MRILQDFDRARLFLQKANNLSPGNKDIIAEIAELNKFVILIIHFKHIIFINLLNLFFLSAVEKWKFLEKDLYKKMFNGSSQQKKSPLAIEASKDTGKLDQKDPNFKIKEQISQILK